MTTRLDKVNSHLFILTYGALVAQLVKDYEKSSEVNEQLEKMGFNIGCRLIDEFIAKSGAPLCKDFPSTGEAIAKIGFKMFLGVNAEVGSWNSDNTSYSILLNDNPLEEFVELPEAQQDLHYSNILCGVIRGALEMVNLKVECKIVRDALKEGNTTEIKVELKELMSDLAGEQYSEGL